MDRRWVIPVVMAAALWPGAAHAQTLVGRVLDESTEAPVIGVLVSVLDRDGDRVLRAESDSLGRYRLRLPGPGEYRIATERLGYERGETPLLDLSFEGGRTLDLVVTPTPIALRGFEVTVSAEERLDRMLATFGVQRVALPDSRVVTTEEIEEVAGALDFGHVLQRQNMAGITVVRSQDRGDWVQPSVCVKVGEGWQSGCARVYVDGIPIPLNTYVDRAALLTPESIEMMVVLKPHEAAGMYGGEAGNGVVLIFTRGRSW